MSEEYPKYEVDEPVIYINGTKAELGVVKKVCGEDDYFINYHTGDTAARTHASHLMKVSNQYAFHITRLDPDGNERKKIVGTTTVDKALEKFLIDNCPEIKKELEDYHEIKEIAKHYHWDDLVKDTHMVDTDEKYLRLFNAAIPSIQADYHKARAFEIIKRKSWINLDGIRNANDYDTYLNRIFKPQVLEAEGRESMNIKEGFTLTQTLTFDDDTGEWTLETHIKSDYGTDEESSISPFGLHGNQYPTVKDCKEEIAEMFGYLVEDGRKINKRRKKK